MSFTRNRVFFKTSFFIECIYEVHSYRFIISKFMSWRENHTHDWIYDYGSQTYPDKSSIFTGWLFILLTIFSHSMHSTSNNSIIFVTDPASNIFTIDNPFGASYVHFYLISYCVGLTIYFIYRCIYPVLFLRRQLFRSTLNLPFVHKPRHTLDQKFGKWSICLYFLLTILLFHFITHPLISSRSHTIMSWSVWLFWCINQSGTLVPFFFSLP